MRTFMEGRLAAIKRDEDYKYVMDYSDGLRANSVRARLKRVLQKQRRTATLYHDDA